MKIDIKKERVLVGNKFFFLMHSRIDKKFSDEKFWSAGWTVGYAREVRCVFARVKPVLA